LSQTKNYKIGIYCFCAHSIFSGGRSWSTRREPPAMGKQLVNFIACSCESSAPFFVTYSRVQTHAVLATGLKTLKSGFHKIFRRKHVHKQFVSRLLSIQVNQDNSASVWWTVHAQHRFVMKMSNILWKPLFSVFDEFLLASV
jgi:hypothetical protein